MSGGYVLRHKETKHEWGGFEDEWLGEGEGERYPTEKEAIEERRATGEVDDIEIFFSRSPRRS